jgi:cytochrome c
MDSKVFRLLARGAGALLLTVSSSLYAAQDSEAAALLQKGACVSCHHSVNKGMGPSYQQIALKYQSEAGSDDFLHGIIRNGSTNKRMPSNRNLSDDEVGTIVGYILEQSGNQTAPSEMDFTFDPSDSAIERGKNLFTGELALKNGGPSCLSCHHAKGVSSFGGGTLATDLSSSFSKFGAEALYAGILSSGFPIMRDVYKDSPISEKESHDIVAFLSQVPKTQSERNYLLLFLLFGVGGTFFCIGVMALLWPQKKEKSLRKRLVERNKAKD